MTSILTSESPIVHAKKILLDDNGISLEDIAKALGLIHRHKTNYADLYFQYTCSENWSLEEGIVKTGGFSISQGVGVRAVAHEKTAFSYSDELSADILLKNADTVKSIATQGSASVYIPKQGLVDTQKLYAPIDPINSMTSEEKLEILNKVEKYARAMSPEIKQVMAGLGSEFEVVLVASTGGRLEADIRPLVRLSLTVIAERNGRRERGNSGGGGRFGLNYFSDEIIKDYVKKAVDEALINLEAQPAPAGEMTVVLGSGWPGVLLHEAVGHGLEGDFNRKGTSVFSGRIGEQVASKGVTVIDDGTIPDRRGSLNIDDEGNPTQRNVLIEDGILCGYLQDTQNASLMNMPITGNARRESYAHLPMPRMTNTFMLGGTHKHEEIIESVKKGIYAANFSGGQVDITSGKFVFSASEAYLIENGKITSPIVGATLIGSGIDTMNKVSMIADNMSLDSGIGTCGKDGQSVPVGVGMPTIRVDGITVGGTLQGR
ncbi:metalloprotease TldD [Taylorella equigenitalis]|uniref:metalloprotease TldD n=1 Tax=Taylorella equigenitalis TaxID=29575 RepID=UPI000401A947|nr:metalloprotease TldD [Taylorella equigenitalis]WDU46870.1 metalloprotease TldD [Taylorella equigenitalis]WDU52335.1 metalloprotease TldD [Taylorella equigenitalis]WEE00903.1 metalloprotease TldD [Taylorella equigenitalis]WEE02381.1 metalloprotease TldD [Taylorella equigenitalis]WFD78920.1 metalloprotease TldD [Taylorella equigenitalis]